MFTVLCRFRENALFNIFDLKQVRFPFGLHFRSYRLKLIRATRDRNQARASQFVESEEKIREIEGNE